MNIALLLLQFSEWAEITVGVYGYFGIFIVSLIGNASIILPIPAFAFIFAMGGILNPWLVGIVGGVGSGIGEITSYLLGRGGRVAALKKYEKQLKQTRKWTENRNLFLLIIFFGATPLPSDIIGIFTGVINYSWKKFLLAITIGKVIISILIALAGFYSFDAIKLIYGV